MEEPRSKSDSQRLQRIVGRVPKGQLTEPTPWHVWKTNRGGQTRYIVLLGESLAMIPGGTSACVQLFDAVPKKINSWCYFTGWRSLLESGSVEYSKNLGTDLIVLQVARVVNGRPIAPERFSLSNDQIQFVRMEDEQGNAVQNEYILPNYEIGVVPEAKTEDDWASLLESKDKADVLSALTFLSGRHLTEPLCHFASEPQVSKYASLFQQLLVSPHMRELIDRLTKSEDPWLRQAAVLAARGPRDRLLQ